MSKGCAKNIGKYQLSRTIGEGTFAKVKLAKNLINGQNVAIKIIDKQMVVVKNLVYQVEREIRTMKLLKHPNVIRIHEVIGTKTKIYIVMEYAPGGQLSDRLSYSKTLSEKQARKYFQQLIDAVDYCHSRGVYHRDLKPENLLFDSHGNLKVSDFGLSTFRKPGSLLLTACGSPNYVAPELLKSKGYEGATADVWACGVILFELLAGYLPFDDNSLLKLYRKICRAKYEFPKWFTPSQKKLIDRILDPTPDKRITIPEIIEDEWFQIDYEPSLGVQFEGKNNADQVQEALYPTKESVEDSITSESPGFINAFQLIAMSHDLNLSGLFEEQDDSKKRIILGSKYTITETLQKIEAAARNSALSVQRMTSLFNNVSFKTFQIKLQPKLKSNCRSYSSLFADVTEVAPTDCVVEISNCAGEIKLHQEFCKSLSSLLTDKMGPHLTRQTSEDGSI